MTSVAVPIISGHYGPVDTERQKSLPIQNQALRLQVSFHQKSCLLFLLYMGHNITLFIALESLFSVVLFLWGRGELNMSKQRNNTKVLSK